MYCQIDLRIMLYHLVRMRNEEKRLDQALKHKNLTKAEKDTLKEMVAMIEVEEGFNLFDASGPIYLKTFKCWGVDIPTLKTFKCWGVDIPTSKRFN